MKKRMVLALLVLAFVLPVFAQNVDETEISSIAGRTVEFINYVGPHERIESAEDIRGIGRSLGRSIAAGSVRVGEAGRYRVIHAVDPNVPDGLDADIIILGEGVLVDHIKNLRRIIAGYLEGAYGYAPADADTLSVFITIYNAVYRGDMTYFGSKYKAVVTKELTAGTAGLSVRWDEWAGRSRIVIPLTSRAGMGVIGSVDSTPITDKPTVATLGKEDAQAAIEERRDVVDIKERDVGQEQAAIDAERQRVAAEEQAIAEEKARLEGQTAAQTATDAGTGDQAAKGADQEASIAVTEQAKAEEATIAAREAQVTQDKQDIAAREEAVVAKQEEIVQDRAAIAEDQKTTIAGEVAAAAAKEAGGVVLFELMDPNQPLARIVLVNLATGETIRKSDINTIRSPTVVDVGAAFVAVAGQTTGTGGVVRLVRVSKADYKDVIQGADDVFQDTPIWRFGTSVYAVVKKGTGWAIGRFDPLTLELKASSAPVTRYTFLTETNGKLVAQKPGSGFLVLDREALTTVSEVKR